MSNWFFSRFWIKVLFLGSLLIFSFPSLSPFYSAGLDGSYSWAINYLFAHDYEQLTQLIYPIGPLGVLKISSTEGRHLELFILFHLVVKATLILACIQLTRERVTSSANLLLSLSMLALVCLVANIDILIMSTSFVLGIHFLQSKKLWNYVLAALFASIGLYIKSSIGIISFLILGSVLIVAFFRDRNVISSLTQLSSLLSMVLLIGLLVFRFNFLLLFNYFGSIPHLSGGYSRAMSLYPANNWLALGAFVLVIGSLPFFFREKSIRSGLLILALPSFAIWKHAMVREDLSHFNHLLLFTIAFSALLIVIATQSRWKLLATSSLAFFLLTINGRSIDAKFESPINLDGHYKQAQILFDLKGFKQEQDSLTLANFAINLLPEDARLYIGNKSIDIYPFEHSYAAINTLNWYPRATLEIGASTSNWASAIAAKHYDGRDEGPAFILLHHLDDGQGGLLGSLDGRYLMNDEPQLILNVLSNYKVAMRKPGFVLFEKRLKALHSEIITDTPAVFSLGEWLIVPTASDSIVRLKVSTNSTLLGRVKDFLYKGEQYFVDYELENGRVISYRFIPSSAELGLWCRPWIMEPGSRFIEPNVVRVRIRCASHNMASENFTYSFEQIGFKGTSNSSTIVFDKTVLSRDTLVRAFDIEQFTSAEQSVLDRPFSIIPPHGFSQSWKCSLDSIWLELDSSVAQIVLSSAVSHWLEAGEANLVITIEGGEKNDWQSQIISSSPPEYEWVETKISKTLLKHDYPNGELIVYVWNNTSSELRLNSFKGAINALVPVK